MKSVISAKDHRSFVRVCTARQVAARTVVWYSLLCCVAPAIAAADPAARPAEGVSVGHAECIALVIKGMRANDRTLGAVAMHVDERVERPGVREEKTIVEPLPGGGSFQWTEKPVYERSARLVLEFGRFRYDYLDANGQTSRTLSSDGTLWSEYDPRRGRMMVRRLDQMAALLPIDPREMAMHDFRRPLLATLHDGKPHDVRAVIVGERTVYDVTLKEPSGQQLEFRFDASLSFMPISAIVRAADGTVLRHTGMSYQVVAPRGALLLKRASTRGFAPGLVRDPAAAQPTMIRTVTVSAVKALDADEFKEQFEIALPDTVRVRDLSTLMDNR